MGSPEAAPAAAAAGVDVGAVSAISTTGVCGLCENEVSLSIVDAEDSAVWIVYYRFATLG